jgi:PAS domain S-box-containing protein
VAISRDITERIKAEEQLRRFAAVIEQAAETVMFIGTDGEIKYVNPALERLTGYAASEVVGRNPFFTNKGIYSSDFYRTIWEAISAGGVWQGQTTQLRKDGSRFELATIISPIRDTQSRITGYVSVGRDVTRELELEQQLRQSQKMEAIGTLAGGIAHDFNNILGAVIGFSELARDTTPAGSPLRHNLDQVLKAADRAKNLVQQILAFSRKSEQERKPLLPGLIVKEALKLLRASIPSTIEIRSRVKDEHCTIIADPTQVHQVLMNLCTNAAHAMQEKGGVLDIELDPIALDADGAALYPDLKPGDYVRLMVRDTGSGIAPGILDRIFDPFFTTKEVGKGTGMGLAVVHGIVKSHGGGIRVESEPGRGTAFYVLLPRIREQVRQEQKTDTGIPTGTESILLVDDEEILLDIGKRMLESLGYRVTPLPGGIQALEVFRKAPAQFDLVITDQTMPRMTGYELAGRILEARQDMPIILCTGYSESISEEKARQLGIRGFIMKPINRAEIARTVRAALDKT